jgi:small conductance mechanosensitive channel
MISVTLLNINATAQTPASVTTKVTNEATNDSKEEEKVAKPEIIKKAVQINDQTILYIGAENEIAANYRTLTIQSAIQNVIHTAITNQQIPVKMNIKEKAGTYVITANNSEIATITDSDIEVNNLEASKLAKIWKTNIKAIIESQTQGDNLLPTNSPYKTIGIAFLITILILGLIEVFRNQLIKLTCFLFTKTLEKFNDAVSQISKGKAKPKDVDIQATTPEEIKNDNELEATEPQDDEELIQKQKQEEEKLAEKVIIITEETKNVINIITRVIQAVALLVFTNYALYTLPATKPYVSEVTHFELSILTVLEKSLGNWLLSKQTWQSFGVILLIVIATIILMKGLNILSSATKNIIHVFLETDQAREKRIQTLIKIIKTTIQIMLILLAAILILSEVGVDITPIIAGASIIGLAVSFGAQSLVKDIITGIFILVENQFGIGDIIMINGTGGVVEDMTLRVTVLRDLSGRAHIIPNGQITMVTAFTKEWSRAHLDIGIAYKEDVDTAIKIIKETADQMHEEFPEKIIADPEVLGVNELGDSSVVIKIIMNTAPAQQWFIEREYRRRIKYAFDNANIEIPFPHRTVYMPQTIGYSTSPTEAKQN